MSKDEFIYKVCSRDEWHEAQCEGAYSGSADDARDGFIHFSTASQLRETVSRHFAGKSDLLLVSVKVETLPEAELRWERSRGGDLFPHLYGVLPVSVATAVWQLPLVDGQHQFPAGL